MNRNKLFFRTTAAFLMVTLLCSCVKQTEQGIKPKPTASTEMTATSEQMPEYDTLELTQNTIAVEPGDVYYLPLGEGKYIPANDAVWKEYLDGQEFSVLENLSMPFIAVGLGESAHVYVIENPFRTKVIFTCEPDLRLKLVAEESPLDQSTVNTVRVYTVRNNASDVANAYKSFLAETRPIMTLEEKAELNPNIRKLYGAPHIYLWGEFLLSEQDVSWPALLKALDSPILSHIVNLLNEVADEDGQFSQVLNQISGQDYVDQYQKNVLLRGISVALTQEKFYDSAVFTKSNATMEALLARKQRNPLEQAELNKQALYENLSGVFQPVEEWYNHDSVDILSELKSAGIDNAWIGLNSWEQAYHKPQIVEEAVRNGYLIGPYDSYHSIHEPGNEQWITAAFPDASLYESATVENEKGEKIAGFQNTGRKLNPTLAMSSVKSRVEGILNTGLQFNSWFVDCDATGEVYDDYSPNHPTTKQQDVAARLERLNYIAREHGMVIGSEGGNDYAANSLAFAHGIELQSFSWMDDDMKSNKENEYYIGKYYSAKGGVPEKFSKPVPVKEKYRKLFLDMSYQAPLYKLVYNNSVISAYHWDWSTFKIVGETENRMLREILYNVPPMYHLDREEWDTYRDRITAHHTVWSAFSKQAITREMTGFAYLTDDRLVQSTQFESNLQAVANFSDTEYLYNETEIPPRSVLLIDSDGSHIYTP